MPLEHGKSRKAFSHNVRVEMEHGKPQKQAVAIAYHMAGEKKAHGGELKHNYKGRPCMACGGAVCNLNYNHLRDQLAEGKMGGDGIPKGMEGHGLGRMAMGGRVPEDDAGMAYGPGSDMAIKKGEMMPLGYAKGGKIRGVHEHNYEGPGNSVAGSFTKAAHKGNTSIPKEQQHEWAKEEHRRVLDEMKSMKKPHGNYADGGEVPSSEPSSAPVSKDKWAQFQSGFNKALGSSKAEASEPEHKAFGGEMGEDEHEKDEGLLMDACYDECMVALKKGDKAAFKDSMKALVSGLIHEMSEE